MRGRIILGAMTVAVILTQADHCVAAGAVALGLPSDVAKQGISMGFEVNAKTMDEAKSDAIARCKSSGSAISKPLCKVVATFQNQCAALAEDPKDGTPGFGWAVANTSQAATDQAMANCRDTAGRARKNACQLDPIGAKCDGSAK
jgi:uncharacterized protein DUF4189